MRKRRLSSFLLAGVLMIASLTGCGSSSSQSAQDKTLSRNADENKGKDAMDNVKLLGRTYRADDGSLWMGLSGTGAELEFTGERLSVTLRGNAASSDKAARVGVFVDGQRTSDICVNASQQTVDVTGKGSTPVTVRIVKLSECSDSCCAIVGADAHGGSIKKASDKQRKIEFIGDSITCGYGVDDPDLTHGFSTATEDCTKGYAYKTAQLLNADHSLVSFSGYGVVSGWTGTGEKNTYSLVEPYYESYGFTENSGFDGKKPSDIKWDFSRFVPDVVVLNLGTNDMSYTLDDPGRQQEYIAGYVDFLKKIRSVNPNAKIICALGTMGTLLCPAMQQAVTLYSTQTGDKNIAAIELPLQDQENDGSVIQGHPTEITHDKAAKLVSEKIKAEMNW
jgi:hypothetical protein